MQKASLLFQERGFYVDWAFTRRLTVSDELHVVAYFIAALVACDPPTIGRVKDVLLMSTVNWVPGSGQSVKSLSLEKIIRPIV